MNIPSKSRRVAVDSTKPLTFKITKAFMALAKCKDPSNCVVALAVMALLGDFFDGIEVGTNITKIYTPGKETRYSTPSSLRNAIRVFDRTGSWNLPEGEYTLLPVPPSDRLGARPNRWDRVSGTINGRQGRTMFKARALPTRRVIRASSLRSV
jgi:hypothetical protein